MKPRLLTILACVWIAGETINAQDTSNTVEPAIELDTFIVTGEKTARPLTETLISVGFVPGDLLATGNLRSVNDAFRFMTNVRDADWIDSGIVIRGINSEGIGGPVGSPMATLYMDGVPQTNNGARRGPLGTWDLAQVEVLRGPQSSLIGRNALAGAVLIQTRDPTFHPEYALQAGVGNQGHFQGSLMASGPLTKTLAFRLSAEMDQSDGQISYPNYVGLPNLDQRADYDYRHFRGKLLYLPFGEERTRVLLTASHTTNSPAYSDADGESAGLDFFDDRQWGNQTSPLFDEARSTDTSIASVQLDVPVDDTWALRSITGYTRTLTDRSSVDAATTGEIDEDEFTQELRFNYRDDRFEAVTGLFLLFSEQNNDREQQRPWEPFLRQDSSEGETWNAAVFGEARWRINDRWSLVGGLRYDHEDTRSSTRSERLEPDGSVSSSSMSTTGADSSALLPKIGLIYRLQDDSNLGFTVQRAYRSGGSAINRLTSSEYSFDPEFAWNYEVAWKGAALAGGFVYAVNLFYMDWADQQINLPQVPGDFTSDIILNAGSSKVWGGEIDLRARPNDKAQLFASVGLAKTEFTDFQFVLFGSPVDLSGMEFPQAAKLMAVIGGDYDLGGGFSVGGDLKYTSSALSRSVLEGLPEDNLPSYWVANMNLGWKRDNWSVVVYVENLLDEEYLLYRYDDPDFQLATVGRGRTYGASVSWRY